MAKLKWKEREVGEVVILQMAGDITFGEGSVALRNEIRRLVKEGKRSILLDFANVGYIDSSGIGELVSSFTSVGREGGQLKLLNLTRRVQDLLAITKLLTVFDVYEDESTALRSFRESGAMSARQ